MCKLRRESSKLTHFVSFTECDKITGKDLEKDEHTQHGTEEKRINTQSAVGGGYSRLIPAQKRRGYAECFKRYLWADV